MKRSQKTKLKKYSQNIILLIAAIIFFFILLEIGLRIFFPQSLSIASFNKDYGLDLKPNIDTTFYNEQIIREFSYKVKTNSDGLREDIGYSLDKGNNFRIITLGDSFTFGNGVNINETFAKQLESKIKSESKDKNVQVINFGVPGTSVQHYYKRLKFKGLKYNPDIVIVGLFIGNDFEKVINTSFTPKIPNQIPYIIASKSHAFKFTYNLITNDLKNIITRNKKISTNRIYIPDNKYNDIIHSFESAIIDFNDLAEKNDFKVIYAIIPTREQVDGNLWNNLLIKINNSTGVERFGIQKDLMSKLNITNSTYIDLTGELAKQNKNNSFYNRFDGHFNKEGNKLAADLIYGKLKDEKIIQSSPE